MRTTRIPSLIVATFLVAGASAATSRADDIASAMVHETSAVVRESRETHESSEVAELQARLAALEARLQESAGYQPQPASGGYGYGGQMVEPSCGCGGHPAGCGCEECCCCNPCCCNHGGVFVDAELVYLKPHNSSGTGFNTAGLAAAVGVVPGIGLPAIGASTLLNLSIDTDFRPSGRYAVGYQLHDGLGVRARYWEYDHDFDEGATLLTGTIIDTVTLLAPSPIDVFHHWDTNVSDLEVFDATDFGGWSLTWSAGFRYVQYEEDRGFVSTAIVPALLGVSFRKSFHGIGLTAGLETRRRVTCHLGVFANARASVLMGDETDSVNVVAGLAGGPAVVVSVAQQQRNDVKYIYEAQLGAEYTLPMCSGGYLFARAGAEVQYWDNFGVSTTGLFVDSSTGFGGFFAAAGIAR